MNLPMLARCVTILITHSALAGSISLTDRASAISFFGDARCEVETTAGTLGFEAFDVVLRGDCAGFDVLGEYSGYYVARQYSEKTLNSEIVVTSESEVLLELIDPPDTENLSGGKTWTIFNSSRFDFTVDQLSAGQVEFAFSAKDGNFPNATLTADGVEVFNSGDSGLANIVEEIVFSPGVNYRWIVNGSVLLATVTTNGTGPSDVEVRTRLKIEDDADLVADFKDNCTNVDNPDQRDTDADGFGNICDPDLNNDCIVNFFDTRIFGERFLSNEPDADLNGDGIVDLEDFSILNEFFLKPPGESGVLNICTF